ncbi:MAG: hypothetical protein R3Y44_00920 [Rikenellaceae bacterium]
MENIDNLNNTIEPTDHDLMVNQVYNDDVELLYLDCCFGELLRSDNQ